MAKHASKMGKSASKTKSTVKKSRAKANPPSAANAELAKVVSDGLAQLRTLARLLGAQNLASLTPDERLHTKGRLRKDEAGAMVVVLDTIDDRPALFQALAPRDHGSDDSLVETGPARAALDRRGLLQPLCDALQKLAVQLGDDMLASASLAKDVTVPAYAIIQANVPIDPALRRMAAPALGYYAKLSKKTKQVKLQAAVKKTASAAAKALAKAKKGAPASAGGASG